MRALVDWLLPPTCVGCRVEGSLWCDACAAPLWRRIDEPGGAPIGLPVSLPSGILQLEWCATYSGVVRDAIHELKYRGQRRLAEPMADAMAARWMRAGAGGELLTWVPVHRSRERERGYDQAELLARAVGRRLATDAASCLQRRQRTAAQHALGQTARQDNTAAAFEVPLAARDAVRGRWLVVVDDIVTTGSTLAGCAAALYQAGAAAVSALCLARDR